MESGMALPHARLPMLKELAFAFGRSEQPLVWGARGTRTVQLVFLFAVPATDSARYLLVISGLVRLAKEDLLLSRLRSAQQPSQILEVFQQIKLRINSTTETRSVVTR
jgi:mannitol/fructose-specific phosphotransferase system IIA component (Ntr-type)